MGWKDLLEGKEETVRLPWTGGRVLSSRDRNWTIRGRLPPEFDWYRFEISGREAKPVSRVDSLPDMLAFSIRGYLVGDRIVADDARVNPNPSKIADQAESVFLIEDGLDRFVRIRAGRICDDGPLIFANQEMPLGNEEAVLEAYLNRAVSVDHIPGVSPALDAAFRMEAWHRSETERLRAEAEAIRKAEEERLAREARTRELMGKLGDSVARRAMAKLDFGEAARSALTVGGAEYLDHRKSGMKGEMIVTYRVDGRRFECVCKEDLRIVDSGICLTEHHTGIKGDTRFTLESLPSVIMEATRTHRLVVYRRVGNEDYNVGARDWDDEFDDQED